MEISIDKNSRKRLKDLIVIPKDGPKVRISNDVYSFEIDNRRDVTLRAEIVIPLRLGSTRKPVEYLVRARETLTAIAISTSPARILGRC